MLSVKVAAERLNLSRSLVYELCRLGLLRHTRHGRPGCRGTIRISDEALDDYRVSCEREGGDASDEGALQFIR